MKIRHLKVTDFAGIRLAEVEFGDGLNVLYGPNDLGKSTLADAIRLGLLLPYSSSYVEEYVPWIGGRSPVVELTFQTDAQRFWRLRKEFRKGGRATLEDSRNNRDYDQVVHGRGVDGRLRELLRWGIPEPGGAGGKGLPTSFLATALLSTQADVSALLADSLAGDPGASGKDRIAAALQAVSQDPLFVRLLREAQARRDEAYTDKGAKKRGRGSVFKEAADRVRELQIERQQLQALVDDSENVEKQLRTLMKHRGEREEALAAASDRVTALEKLAAQAAARRAAEDEVRAARKEVGRIRQIDRDIQTAGQDVADLVARVTEAQQTLAAASLQQAESEAAFKVAQDAAVAESPNAAANETVMRQALALREAAASRIAGEAQRRIDAAIAARTLVDAAQSALADQRTHETAARSARTAHEQALSSEREAAAHLASLDVLERAITLLAAEGELNGITDRVNRASGLRARLESETAERDAIAARRAGITVPVPSAVVWLRKLEHDLVAAHGALNVGLVITVTPERSLDIGVQSDAGPPYERSTAEAFDVEAGSHVEITLADLASVRIRGGRREAQERAAALERRWAAEALPVLAAAAVEDLDALAARIEEASALSLSLKAKDAELDSIRAQLDAFGDLGAELSQASARVDSCRAALGEIRIESLQSELTALGRDSGSALRARRQKGVSAAEAARAAVGRAATARTLAEERLRTAAAAVEQAVRAHEEALSAFPGGLDAELSAAQEALSLAKREQQTVASELASLERVITERARKIEAALSAASAAVQQARIDVAAAQQARNTCGEEHAGASARLELLRAQRAAEDLDAAEARLASAMARRDALPQPPREVDDADITAARRAESRVRSELDHIVGEIHKAQGALEQVGGAVARERLREVTEACVSAELREKEIEEEYEAWLLLLEQMKAADAAQASNLGQVLAPAVAGKFEELTNQRYESVHIDSHLATQGVVIDGALRPTARVSVGTREQLSTLYRLALAEYLRTTVVLDDQLVQSDVARMDWFRTLLTDKAARFQIIVFTCRPDDYLPHDALVPPGQVHYDSAPLRRSIDLERAIQRV